MLSSRSSGVSPCKHLFLPNIVLVNSLTPLSFYILGLTLVGLLVSSTDDRLLNSSNPYKDGTSPFVLAAVDAGLKGFDSFMNLVICVSVVSIGVSCVYGGSRTLTALAEQDYAPKFFTYVDRSGRPLMSVLFTLAWGALAYIVLASSGGLVFDWLLAVSALAALFTWGSICAVSSSISHLISTNTDLHVQAHIRFRSAWKRQGRSLDQIPFRACGGVYGSWLGLILCFVILGCQLYVAVCPPFVDGYGDANDFFMACLAIPVVLVFWVIGYVWKRPQWLTMDKIDLDTGLREHDWDEINAYRAKVASWPKWRQALHKFM